MLRANILFLILGICWRGQKVKVKIILNFGQRFIFDYFGAVLFCDLNSIQALIESLSEFL